MRSTEESSFLDRPSIVSQSTVLQSTGKGASSPVKGNSNARRVSDIHGNHAVHGREEAAGLKTPQEMMTTPMNDNAPANIEYAEYQACLDYVPPANKSLPPSAMVPSVALEFVRDPSDGSAVLDHKGVPITVDRFLATKPLKGDILSRPGPGGCKLTYMSGEAVSRCLNETFGFDGWNLDIVKTQKEDCFKDERGRFHVAYTAQVRVTHKRSGSYKEDCGAGDAIDKNMGNAVANAVKASVTDAMKRAARHFGNKIGNSLYCGKFNIRNAPQTLKDALEIYDRDRAKYNFDTNNPPISNYNNDMTIKREDYSNMNTKQVSAQVVRSSVIKNEAINGCTTKPMQNRTYQQRNLAQIPTGSNPNHTEGSVMGKDTATSKSMARPASAGEGLPKPTTKRNQSFSANNNSLGLAPPKCNQHVDMDSKHAKAPQHLPVPSKPPQVLSEYPLFDDISDIFGDSKENDLSSLDFANGFVSRPSTSSGNKSKMGMTSIKRQGSAVVAPNPPKRPNNNPYVQI